MSFLSACYPTDLVDEKHLEERPLSLLERYHYMSTITRAAHTITYLYQYSSTTLPSTPFLHNRVHEVQQKVHHLWAEVVDGETPRPALRLRPVGPWPSSDIVREDVYDQKDGSAEEADLIAKEVSRMKARVADDGPAWQITRYHPSSTSLSTINPIKDKSEPPCYIAISIYHHLADGTGSLHLSHILLSDCPIPAAPGLALRMEDLIPIAPSWRYLLKDVYKELIVPNFPSWLSPVESCWPDEKVKGNPAHFPEAHATLHLPAAWIGPLKQAGKANGVPTLNSTLEVALVLALHEVMGSPAGTLQVLTPLKERDASNPTHPQIGSIYFSALRKFYSHLDFPLSHIFTDEKPNYQPLFWSLARGTASHHSSPTEKRHARYGVGIMAYIPDPANFSSPHSENPDRRTKTGWEEFFWSGTERPAPFRTSVAISNLGKYVLPAGCQGMRWSQSASAIEEALLVSIIGHDLGLEVSFSFRDGCAISSGEMERVLRRYEEILGGLI